MGVIGGGNARAAWWVTVTVLLLSVVGFLPSVTNGLAMDDDPLASGWSVKIPGRQDPVVGELKSPGFYLDKFYWYSEYVNDGLYRPVTIYSYALVYNLIGKRLSRESEATPQHALNLVLHAFATLLVLLLLKRIGVSSLPAHVGAGLFGVHAIHSEVVAGVVGRAELLAFCFGLWAILLFARAVRVTSASRHLMLAGASVLFFLSYASKESGLACCPLLFCFVMALHWRRAIKGANPSGRLGLAAAVSVIPMAAYLMLRHQVMQKWERVELIDYVSNPLYHTDVLTRICTAIKLLGYGLYKCVAPAHLSASYGPAVFELDTSPLGIGVLASFVVLAAFLFVGLRFARRSPVLFLAMTIFLGCSFITSNIPFAVGTLFAERLYYMPSLGICMLAALLVQKLNGHRVLLVVLGAWALGNIVIAWQRNGAWKDTETLFLTEAVNQPLSADMQVKAALVLRKKIEEYPTNGVTAMGYLERALELVEGYPHALREKAALHAQLFQYDEAIQSYQAAVDSKYPELADTKSLAFVGIASIHRLRGAKDLAVEFAKKALALAPLDGNAWLILIVAGPGVLPQKEMRDYFTTGSAALKKNSMSFGRVVIPPVMAMYLGVMGENVGADPRRVFEVLEYGAKRTPVDKRPEALFAATLLAMAQAKARAGEIDVARGLFESLLANPKLQPDYRKRVSAAFAKLPPR